VSFLPFFDSKIVVSVLGEVTVTDDYYRSQKLRMELCEDTLAYDLEFEAPTREKKD